LTLLFIFYPGNIDFGKTIYDRKVMKVKLGYNDPEVKFFLGREQ